MPHCRLLFALLVLLACPCFAAGSGFKVGEIKLGFEREEAVGLVMNYDYDGRYGEPRLVFAARSTDGVIHSYFHTPGYVQGKMQLLKGKNQRIDFNLLRPGSELDLHTDLVYLGIITDKGLAYSTLLAYPHKWAAVTPDASPETHTRRRYVGAWTNDSAVCWLTYDFACLDSAFSHWRDGRHENLHGISELATLAQSIRRWMEPHGPEKNLAKLKQWKKQFPDSQARALVEAMYWQESAEAAIGSRDWPSGEAAAASLYLSGHGKAVKALQVVPEKARSPHWYVLYLQSLGAMQGESSAVVKSYKAAIAAYPTYPSIYVAMAQIRLLTDAHAWVDVDELAQQAAAQAGLDSIDSALLYSKVYVELARSKLAVVTGKNAVAWPKMRQGLAEAARRYPQARNDNVAAIWACGAGDAGMYVEFRGRIGDRILRDLWPDNQSLDLCDRRFNYSPGAKT